LLVLCEVLYNKTYIGQSSYWFRSVLKKHFKIELFLSSQPQGDDFVKI
jgi:hypothetical protein